MRRTHAVFFRRAASGVSVWRGAFVHVGLSYRCSMIWGMFAVVKGGFSVNASSDGGREIPADARMWFGIRQYAILYRRGAATETQARGKRDQ